MTVVCCDHGRLMEKHSHVGPCFLLLNGQSFSIWRAVCAFRLWRTNHVWNSWNRWKRENFILWSSFLQLVCKDVLIESTSRSWKLFNIKGDTWVLDSSVDVTWSASTLQVDKTSGFNINCFLGISLEHLWKSFSFDLLSVETTAARAYCDDAGALRGFRKTVCLLDMYVVSSPSLLWDARLVDDESEPAGPTKGPGCKILDARVVTVVGYVLTVSHASTRPLP
jgi:hypothetical protein